jgi:hypothetical protein
MRGSRRLSWGRSPVQLSIAKSVAWPRLSGSGGRPLPGRPTKQPTDAHSNLVSSSRLVPTIRDRPIIRTFERAYAMKLFQDLTKNSFGLFEESFSCLMFRVTVPSFHRSSADGALEGSDLPVLSQLDQVCRRRVLRRPTRSAFERSIGLRMCSSGMLA